MTAGPNNSAPSAPLRETRLFKDEQRAKERNAASWQSSETAFADRMLARWNHHLGLKRRANNVRRNRFAAIQFFRWLCHQSRESERDPGAPGVMTEGDVELAIRAYAEDPANIKLGRWISFHDWFSTAADRVDEQLARIGRPRGNRCLASGTVDALAKQRASELLSHAGWQALYATAAANVKPLRDYLAELVHTTRRSPREHAYYRDRLAILDRLAALPEARRDNLRVRAKHAAEAYLARQIDPSAQNNNLVVAFAAALLDKYGERLFAEGQ